MTEHTPPEHSGSMDTDRTGLHGFEIQATEHAPAPGAEPFAGSYDGPRGPLADLDGEIGAEARRLVAALNPHPTQVADVERVVAGVVARLAPDERETLVALRYVIETAVSRASAAPLMVPRGDQQGERVAGRAEPPVTGFCGFHSIHPAHNYTTRDRFSTVLRCLGMDASGPRG